MDEIAGMLGLFGYIRVDFDHGDYANIDNCTLIRFNMDVKEYRLYRYDGDFYDIEVYEDGYDHGEFYEFSDKEEWVDKIKEVILQYG